MKAEEKLISEFAYPDSLEYRVVQEIKRELGKAMVNATKGFERIDAYRYTLSAIEGAMVNMICAMKPEVRMQAVDDLFTHIREEVRRYTEEGPPPAQ